MDLIDNINFLVRLIWSKTGFIYDVTDIINAGVRCGINLDHVDRTTLNYLATGITLVAGFA